MKPPTLKHLLEQILDETIKKNYQGQIKDLERQLDIVKGNLDGEVRRREALERHLGVDLVQDYKFIKKRK